MGTLTWRGDELFERISQRASVVMADALAEGVQAAKDHSSVDTGNYRDHWEEQPVIEQGDTLHGEIINEARNPSGGFYGGYRSAGTSRIEGDFAHAAALDTAGQALVRGLQDIV